MWAFDVFIFVLPYCGYGSHVFLCGYSSIVSGEDDEGIPNNIISYIYIYDGFFFFSREEDDDDDDDGDRCSSAWPTSHFYLARLV